jgi:predicted transcriptional regulator
MSNFNEILRLYDEGKTPREIAAYTGIGQINVSKYLRNQRPRKLTRPIFGKGMKHTYIPEIDVTLFHPVEN